ncbi:MAG: aminoacyl-tRNA hydrolase [Candidatus Melainabacteria bacterium]|nr:MAG: aminoacyl-tRNA hydrolase [Candidatus Melainabacteria bacterium]
MATKLIVGLGNIGNEYVGTRHNAGFSVIDELAQANVAGGIAADFKLVKDFHSHVGKAVINGSSVILAKPTTYMNLSGRAVNAILNYFKIELHDLLIVHDDVSLPLGRLRMQKAGGAGGQHGVESIIEALGGRKEFSRLKFGVGPDPGGARRAQYVLSRIPAADQELYQKMVRLSAEAISFWVSKGVIESMNKYNSINLAPPPPENPQPIVSE